MKTDARRWWALGATNLVVLAAGLDATVLNLALPALAAALHASESDLQWFSAGYALTLSAGMVPAGLLGDRYGRKKVLLLSLVLFAAGSLACAYAPTSAAFLAARAVLGLAGAGLVTMCLAAVTVLFSEAERPRAVGVWAAANFLALPIGPLLGGWLLSHYWWGWVFLINLPLIAVAVIAVVALLPESRSAPPPGLDLLGLVASSAGLVALTYGLIQAGRWGWSSVSALAPLLVGALLLCAFVVWERRLSRQTGGQPLIDLALFRSRGFTWGTLLAGAGVLAMSGALFTLPQYFQGVRGTDAQGAGLRLMPLIAGLVLGAVPADRCAARLGSKVTAALGFALLAAGMAVGATTSVKSGDVFTALWLALCGAGMGLALATASSGALVELSAERSGVGSAVMQAIQKLGGPFGAAILGSILNARYQDHLSLAGLPAAGRTVVRASVFAGIALAHRLASAPLLHEVRAAFVQGMDGALLASAGIALGALLFALLFLPRREGPLGTRAADPVHWEEKGVA